MPISPPRPALAPVLECFYSASRLPALAILKTVFSFRVSGREHLDAAPGPVILAGNHTGLLDGPLLYTTVRRPFRFIVTTEVFGWKKVGWLVRNSDVIPLARGREIAGLKSAVRDLRAGRSVCIFPEGKLTGDGNLNPFLEGIGLLQQQSGVPILPFAIRGGYEAWAFGRSMPTPHPIGLAFGPPLLPEDLAGLSRGEIAQRVRARIEEILHTPAGKAFEAFHAASRRVVPHGQF